ncbi:MAG: hypothetical protein NFCOHLIN_03251 [Gammaproteobacteria bacterium]|nr:hypothetical protein [Gammaproteobacteria bacterium]
MTLTIIVPMLNELAQLPELLTHLLHWRRRGCEVILVDGGSTDGCATMARRANFTVLDAACGRAPQMNAGAHAAGGEVLLFLHADTRLPADADALVAEALARRGHDWGRFDVHIEGSARALVLIGWMMNQRSRLSGIATGDQGIFVRRSTFERVGGFPDQPLMEDLEFSRRLLRLSAPACLRARVTTSGRRWETRGISRTVVLMWRLRWAYWRGVPADELARAYR